MILAQKWGITSRGQKNSIFLLSQNRLAMRHCRQIGHLALDAQAETDNAKTQYTQALVRPGWHAYYTLAQQAGTLGEQKVGWDCLRND